MKKTEKDYEYLETSSELRERGLKRITRPKHLDKIPKKVSLKDCKNRITIYLDADIVEHFKKIAEDSESGYQTLINQSLREIVDGQEQTEKPDIKQEILQDRQFLQELKEALALEA